MESKCPECGAPKSHPDNRYFVCGADGYGQYPRTANCICVQVAAQDARIASLTAEAADLKESNRKLADRITELNSELTNALLLADLLDQTEDQPNAR